jgi:hypothetical protein
MYGMTVPTVNILNMNRDWKDGDCEHGTALYSISEVAPLNMESDTTQ